MNHFLYRLVPPRPTFPADMTEAEGAVMQEHFAYWAKLISGRTAVAYGPVMDPKGSYGVAFLEVTDEVDARSIAENDPAIKAKAGFSFELHQMPDARVRR